MKTPHFTMGNDELAKMPALKDEVLCTMCGKMHKVCGKMHKVKYGSKGITKSGREIPSKTLAFVRCRGKLFLAGINGKDITLRFRKH